MTSEPTWLSLLPPLVAIAAALLLRRVAASLLAGVVLGALVLAKFDWLFASEKSARFLLDAVTDGGHLSILAFALILGGLMAVMRESGGSGGMAERVTRWANTRRRGQLAAWFLGLLFFFDDYANTLFVGSSMRPVIRRLRISAEKLAFVIDATAAPVASLAPLSSWIAVEVGYIADQLDALAIPGDAYSVFLSTLPYRFYPLFMLMFGLMVAWSGRDFGPMVRAEQAAAGGVPHAGPARSPATDPTVAPASPPSRADCEPPVSDLRDGVGKGSRAWLLAALPLVVVVLAVVIGLYVTGRQGALDAGVPITLHNVLTHASSSRAMLVATAIGGIAALIGAVATGRMRLRAGLGAWVRGMGSMVPVVLVLLLAWSLGAVCRELQTARFVVSSLGQDFHPGLLPAATFVVSGVVSFATGTSWGTMGIVFPLAAPLAQQLAPGNETVFIGSLSAVLAGSVFGDHCSPISDTTIMSALAAGCDQIQHVRTQLPYALWTGAVSLGCGVIPVGFGWAPPWFALTLGAVVLYTGLRWFSPRHTPP